MFFCRDGSVVVASFYLPVTLTRRTASDTSGETAGVAEANADGDGGGGADCDGWVAEWDHEQLIALQVRQREPENRERRGREGGRGRQADRETGRERDGQR